MDHTDEYIKEISEKIDSKKDYYAEISNKIWEFAEPRFQEYRSSELLQHVLKQAGFSIKADLAGEKTAIKSAKAQLWMLNHSPGMRVPVAVVMPKRERSASKSPRMSIGRNS